MVQDWPVEERAHTDIMTRLGGVEEPATVAELVQLILSGGR